MGGGRRKGNFREGVVSLYDKLLSIYLQQRISRQHCYCKGMSHDLMHNCWISYHRHVGTKIGVFHRKVMRYSFFVMICCTFTG